MQLGITQRIIKNKKKVGMFVSYLSDNKVYIGYSLCCKSDKYDNEKAIKIAYNRASYCWDKLGIRLAHSIRKDFEIFYERCCRFYKQSELPEIISVRCKDGVQFYGIKSGRS